MDMTIDGREIPSREALHARMKQELEFPDWYGGNLDAMVDCLTDLRQETSIRVTGFSGMREALGTYADRWLRALKGAAAENPALHLEFGEDGDI